MVPGVVSTYVGGGALHPAFFQPLFFTLPFCPLLEIRSTLLHSLGHYLQYFLREPVFQAEARFSKKCLRLCAPPRFLFCSWCVLARRGLWLVFLMSLGFRCRNFFFILCSVCGWCCSLRKQTTKEGCSVPGWGSWFVVDDFNKIIIGLFYFFLGVWFFNLFLMV